MSHFVSIAALLESANAPWFVLDILLSIFMCWYIVTYYDSSHGYSIFRAWRVGELEKHLQLAIAIFVVHTGSAMVRGWAWALRYVLNRHREFPVDGTLSFLLIGTMIAVVGMVCMIRIITVARLGRWPWIAAAALAVASSIGTQLLP